jgi:plasmid stabilization system protein ParE
VEIYWTEPAEEHLRAIHAHLAGLSPNYADRMVDRITLRTIQLARFPRSGPVVPDAESLQIRELIEGPYRILYVVARDHIEILGVLHGSREGL